MSNYLFMQDARQSWCSDHFSWFWKKGEWPGNSPDRNPIENLWAILSERLDEMEEISRIDELNTNLKNAWSTIDPKILTNLFSGMLKRITGNREERRLY